MFFAFCSSEEQPCDPGKGVNTNGEMNKVLEEWLGNTEEDVYLLDLLLMSKRTMSAHTAFFTVKNYLIIVRSRCIS
jgi:hypothetical protein